MIPSGAEGVRRLRGVKIMKLQTILVVAALFLGSCTGQAPSSDQSADALAAAKIKICPDGSTHNGNKPCPTTTPTTTSPPVMPPPTVAVIAPTAAGEVAI